MKFVLFMQTESTETEGMVKHKLFQDLGIGHLNFRGNGGLCFFISVPEIFFTPKTNQIISILDMPNLYIFFRFYQNVTFKTV